MSSLRFKIRCLVLMGGSILLNGGMLLAQSRHTVAAQLRIRVVVVPSIAMPASPSDRHQAPVADSSISFELIPRKKPVAHSTRDIVVVNPETHKKQKAQLQTTTIVAE